MSSASSDSTSPILIVEPERYFYAINDLEDSSKVSVSIDYLRGYRDAVVNLVDKLVGKEIETQAVAAATFNQSQATWGLQVTKVLSSKFSGKGIKVAILDSGFDFNHPDFVGRTIISQSFVRDFSQPGNPLLPVQDVNGHGTHCIGIACGSYLPQSLPRYGIAYDAEIYVGKVLDNGRPQARTQGFNVVDGIDWAVRQGCHVISMSLGVEKRPGDPYSQAFENAAQRALNAGSLVIAAAGNSRLNSSGFTAINRPADCPSVMAVAAIDSQMNLYPKSSPSDGQIGGQIDIAAPGVNVYSSYVPTDILGSPTGGYATMTGTSMAAPHVAGIAALYAEATKTRGQALWNELVRNALRLPLSSTDVGAGLVQAP